MKKKKSLIKIFAISFLALTILLIASLLIYSFNIDKIDLTLIRSGATSITRIYYFDKDDRRSREGTPHELKDEELFMHKHDWISIDKIPKNLINAFVAIEDKRFYEHKGVDWARTSKAILNYLFKLEEKSFGGSSITQQLVKNVTGNNETTIKRKIDEIIKALDLEKKASKREILEYYLNVVYLGENCYGVATASEVYFNKDISNLSLKECAMLASIVKGPSIYNPHTNLDNNLNRSLLVLNALKEQGYIDDNEYKNAINENVEINPNIENISHTGIYSWFTEALLKQVSEDLSKKYNIAVDTAKKEILKGGYRIYSTIDPEIQHNLENIYKNYPLYIQMQGGKYPESACVIIDPKTSDVLALIGGIGDKKANMIFNRATDAKRPPGSVLKPLSVYAPSIDLKLINYATVFDDTPLALKKGYWPKNSPNRYRGLVPVYYAVEHSINTVAVKALQKLGIKESFNYLDNLMITYDKERDYNESSLALGQLTNGETLLNITNAYSIFANDGKLSNPKTYLYVTDYEGNVILENENDEREVITKETAFIMTKILQGVVNNGTAKNISNKNLVNVAGKTGTSSNNEDKWFVGYTNDYVLGVRVGFDTPNPIYCNINPATIIFDEMIKRIYSDTVKQEEEIPYEIIERDFCFDSGMLYSNSCTIDLRGTRVVHGYFTRDNMPSRNCDMHKTVYVTEDGKISNRILPFWKKRKVSLLDYERDEYKDLIIEDNEYLIKSRD
ncbi:MAG: PBP1A family penicillin-binding protein [Clostridia bacterium]|nr:PBP1A family penicillin-binding protein [Clostridia bacterium]